MKNILIIKTNASGDVLRTTILLHFLKGNIFWLTAKYNIPLFPDGYPNLTVIALENERDQLLSVTFDLVINLEEDHDLIIWAGRLQTRELIGVFQEGGVIQYTPGSAKWFDMSLISKLSVQEANEAKFRNRLSYQEIVCDMIGESFSSEPYILHKTPASQQEKNKIGIEPRVGKRWPNKQWHGYNSLNDLLRYRGNDTVIFRHREALRQYMADIQGCQLLITGDTLAMHIAIGYSIPCIAIFNCTSPHEIYDYGVVHKLVSPVLYEVFYKTALISEATQAISIDSVLEVVNSIINSW